MIFSLLFYYFTAADNLSEPPLRILGLTGFCWSLSGFIEPQPENSRSVRHLLLSELLPPLSLLLLHILRPVLTGCEPCRPVWSPSAVRCRPRRQDQPHRGARGGWGGSARGSFICWGFVSGSGRRLKVVLRRLIWTRERRVLLQGRIRRVALKQQKDPDVKGQTCGLVLYSTLRLKWWDTI